MICFIYVMFYIRLICILVLDISSLHIKIFAVYVLELDGTGKCFFLFLSCFFLDAACRSSWARGSTRSTAVTKAAAVTMLDP